MFCRWCGWVPFMLLLVSTLATNSYARQVPSDQIQKDLCEGKHLCDVKPDDYPQEEIDWMVLKHLSQLHASRVKRDLTPAPSRRGEGNCKTFTQMIKPYRLKNADGLPITVVQSKWFEQQLPHIICASPGASCFEPMVHGIETECVPKMSTSKLITYDEVTKEINSSEVQLGVDCTCNVKT